jgi:hypothetical protein
VSRPTPVRSWDGLAVFSVYDAQARVYRLAVARGSNAPTLVPVAPRPVPFDADVGPDSRGQAIVYSRCAVEPKTPSASGRGCNLYRFSRATGVEVKISNADSDAASEVSVATCTGPTVAVYTQEVNPTIWRGRIVWARILDGRADAQPVVYTRSLAAPRSRRSQRLPGIPTRRCSDIDARTCGPTDAIEPPVLELYGRWIGLIVRYDYRGAGGVCGRWEVRLSTLDGDARQVADQTCGLDGQSYVGVSFHAGRLYFAHYCGSRPSGCGRHAYGAFRYRLSDASYGLAQFGRRLTGFAYTGADRAYEVRADNTSNGYCGNSLPDEPAPACDLVLTDEPRFASTRAPR